ncbi:phage N-6-adenine-methyltransferase [Rheinheimera sp. MMS21-TC3]|uniref:phage N-6-adenine-methyltransferase n=1 Tax=Rheinheimera sp. MMS21-TC3 TaxID=3072790 RepID=UPI0028C3E880|nr:phage N-6-adenine-methyltransferase [Rheinheimera sp. MMS21-TC3]WNO60853.1 phage N-6-adenine-methyltransferase [Rheinheimera sp. MMS21-TC3]
MSKDAYQTPPEVFAFMNSEFNFKSDVCASVENSLCKYYITEQLNCLTQNWLTMCIDVGDYVWMNPPYSNIGPFVARSAEMAKQGIGTVMLVMMDQSVGWYKEAVKTCQEVRLVIGGRLSFINPLTGTPAAGNNKGSMFIIWHPFGRTAVQYSHLDRDELLEKGRETLATSNQLDDINVVNLDDVLELTSNSTQLDQPDHNADASKMVNTHATDIDDGTKPLILEFTSEQLQAQLASGTLPFNGDHLALMLQLDAMFGKQETYTSKQVKAAVIAFDEPQMVSKAPVKQKQHWPDDITEMVDMANDFNGLKLNKNTYNEMCQLAEDSLTAGLKFNQIVNLIADTARNSEASVTA